MRGRRDRRLNVEVEETGPVERKLVVEIPTADVDAAFDGVYKALRRGARIAGFRPGKVPRGVMQRYYGEQARGEVMERLVQETLPKAVEEASLDVVGQPKLDADEPPHEGAPFRYAALCDIRPEITLQTVRGLELTRPELPEPEEDPVERHLEELRTHQAQTVDEEPGTAAARGLLAVIDYEATVDGEPFDGSQGQETVVELGESRAIPGLEDELVGLTVGDEKSFALTLPDTFPVEAVAGKEAQFRVKLVALKRRELPELDDELAKDVSEFESLAELRADLQDRVAKSREREEKRGLREAALDALVAANPFPVPQSLVDHQLQVRISRAVNQLRQLPQEELGKLVESWREEWRPQAERDVQVAFLVPAIAEQEKLEVTDDDVDARVAEIAEESGQPVAQVKRSYREQGLADALRQSLLEERVVDFLIAEATVSEA